MSYTQSDPISFKDFSGFEFSELIPMNLGTLDACEHYYHKRTDTVYSWDCFSTPRWVKNDTKTSNLLKKFANL